MVGVRVRVRVMGTVGVRVRGTVGFRVRVIVGVRVRGTNYVLTKIEVQRCACVCD